MYSRTEEAELELELEFELLELELLELELELLELELELLELELPELPELELMGLFGEMYSFNKRDFEGLSHVPCNTEGDAVPVAPYLPCIK